MYCGRIISRNNLCQYLKHRCRNCDCCNYATSFLFNELTGRSWIVVVGSDLYLIMQSIYTGWRKKTEQLTTVSQKLPQDNLAPSAAKYWTLLGIVSLARDWAVIVKDRAMFLNKLLL